jgi:AraC family transcriptional regulator
MRSRDRAVQVIRKTLFDGASLRIGTVDTRPKSDACGEVEWQGTNVVVLPFSGVFVKHDAPGRHVTVTPTHAVFIKADASYRVSFPGAIGDRALALRFGDALAPEQLERNEALAPHGLLPAHAMMLRNLLWRRLQRGEMDDFEIEALGLDLLAMSLASMRSTSATRRSTRVLRARSLERVKEAVALAPAEKWTVARLARIANLSPFHLCHVFRRNVGTSLYDYVLHERLARTLDAVLDCHDLTAVALDAGFSSHSHFTARFRNFFGCTPAALRRIASGHVAEMHKIMTARRSALALN